MAQPSIKPSAGETVAAKMSAFHVAGFLPLFDHNAEGARDLAEQAVALLTVIGCGWENEEGSDAGHDNLSRLNSRIHVEALAGVRTLVALSAYCAAQVPA